MTDGTTEAKAPEAIGTLDAVVIDAPDTAAAAAFWRELTGAEDVVTDEDQWVTVETPDGWSIAFQPAPDLVRAEWPGQERPQQAHLDLRVPDVGAEVERAVGLGAKVLRENDSWTTLADPAGHPFDLCFAEDNPGVTILGVTFDVPDASAAAAFWSRILGEAVVYDADGRATLGGDSPLLFQQVEGYNRPRWPDPAYPQQIHLDLWTGERSLDDAEAAALDAGATRLPGGGDTFRVFADPAGHPFCLLG
jgi:catechol 2,3-dioxygenase-like lactoylglutathione lyase family enzyme